MRSIKEWQVRSSSSLIGERERKNVFRSVRVCFSVNKQMTHKSRGKVTASVSATLLAETKSIYSNKYKYISLEHEHFMSKSLSFSSYPHEEESSYHH